MKGMIRSFFTEMGMVLIIINLNMGYDTPFLSYVTRRYIFANFFIESVVLSGIRHWVGSDKDILMSMLSAMVLVSHQFYN